VHQVISAATGRLLQAAAPCKKIDVDGAGYAATIYRQRTSRMFKILTVFLHFLKNGIFGFQFSFFERKFFDDSLPHSFFG